MKQNYRQILTGILAALLCTACAGTDVSSGSASSGAEYEYAMKQENGLVTEAVTSIRMPDQEPEETEKIVFTYTEIETDQARYTAMINYFLMHGGENFYSFNWY